MKMAVASIIAVGLILGMASAVQYPVYSPGAGDTIETCSGISCAPLDCKPPFSFRNPEETGTCCPLCLADEIKTPEDRSWAKGMSGGVGMDNNADPILCRDVGALPWCAQSTTSTSMADAAQSASRLQRRRRQTLLQATRLSPKPQHFKPVDAADMLASA
eukprot:CAMPEP_0178452116 /NCGR_PEP_ID=MMETSP0689_2-20121128/44063_1 /TAXON_ID=160604 /ORGANISM="Amphidinium massartii, Strain CS-259" /LENGTH=159 /DNA_ID=CAMNT_0020077781 /DNA_START=96 /DNA_END=573 /DNA_ORIENTATION=+